MSRPGRGCLTCKLAKCTGCDKIQCTPEESAMTRCAGLPRKNARTKKSLSPVTARLSEYGEKLFHAHCSMRIGDNAI
jgi:hypothetical protein